MSLTDDEIMMHKKEFKHMGLMWFLKNIEDEQIGKLVF